MDFTSCCHEGCGVVFGMPSELYNQLLKSKAWFYCPHGHQQHFTAKSKEQELQERLIAAQAREQRAIKEKQWAEQNAKHAEHDAKVARSHAKRAVTISRQLRQRIKAGTCPCCEHQFDDLAAHMKAEHPKYR